MKKLLWAFVAVVTFCACSGERGYLDYRGLSMGMSAKSMCDSFLARGFQLDSNLTDSGSSYVLYSQDVKYKVGIYYTNDTISDIIESYTATYNDSTSELWQVMRDSLNELQGRMPYMAKRADLHKEAIFQTDEGTINVKLLNTYSPTMEIRYSTEIVEY